MVQSQLVTAGTYYREVATSEESEKVLAADVPVLTQEMFYCSKKAGCGTLGRMKNQKLYQEVSRGVDLTGYDEIIEKNKSGELEGANLMIYIELNPCLPLRGRDCWQCH